MSNRNQYVTLDGVQFTVLNVTLYVLQFFFAAALLLFKLHEQHIVNTLQHFLHKCTIADENTLIRLSSTEEYKRINNQQKHKTKVYCKPNRKNIKK